MLTTQSIIQQKVDFVKKKLANELSVCYNHIKRAMPDGFRLSFKGDRPMKHVNIYTDGACRNNPGRGGWGAILVYEGREKELSGGEPMTTNNRMELSAVIAALSALREPCDVTLTTDSQYVVNAIEKGWLDSWRKNGWKKSDKSKVLNVDLWEKLILLLETHKVSFVWVKGHNGHPYNERCDVLATDFADSFPET